MSTTAHPGHEALLRFAERAGLDGREPMAALGGAHAYDAEQARSYRPAAVLALFAPTDRRSAATNGVRDALDLFLVQRSPLLRLHPGQISLPGGSLEDGESAVEAAVRETEEEIGLPREHVQVLATLAEVLVPHSGFVVTPVLGWTDEPEAAADVAPGEVLHTLRVPVAGLLDPAQRSTVTIAGHRSAGFRVSRGWVWGFTGNLLDHLFMQIGWDRPWPRERVHQMSADEARGARLLDR